VRLLLLLIVILIFSCTSTPTPPSKKPIPSESSSTQSARDEEYERKIAVLEKKVQSLESQKIEPVEVEPPNQLSAPHEVFWPKEIKTLIKPLDTPKKVGSLRIKLIVKKPFTEHPEAPRWERIIDRNLCWSGHFKVLGSRYASCRFGKESWVDKQILLDVQNNQLIISVANTEGLVLFSSILQLKRNNFRESKLMLKINELTEKLIGMKGILGSTIAFTLKQPKRRKIIARVNTHGNQLGAISRNPSISLLPRWSPDGNSILYTRVSRSGVAIILNKLKGKPIILLNSDNRVNSSNVNFLNVSGGTWFSDGTRLIVTVSRKGNKDLYEFDLNRREETRVTKHPSIDTAPSLSPDNKQLVFVSDRTGREQIYHHQLGSGIEIQLTEGGASRDPAWSPDGTMIAFTRIVRGNAQIHILDAFTGEERALTQGRYNSEQPSWSPDGKQIVFAANSTGVSKLYVMFIDGTGRRRLTRTPREFEESEPDWRPTFN